jgi:hypothetical protein
MAVAIAGAMAEIAKRILPAFYAATHNEQFSIDIAIDSGLHCS